MCTSLIVWNSNHHISCCQLCVLTAVIYFHIPRLVNNVFGAGVKIFPGLFTRNYMEISSRGEARRGITSNKIIETWYFLSSLKKYRKGRVWIGVPYYMGCWGNVPPEDIGLFLFLFLFTFSDFIKEKSSIGKSLEHSQFSGILPWKMWQMISKHMLCTWYPLY